MRRQEAGEDKDYRGYDRIVFFFFFVCVWCVCVEYHMFVFILSSLYMILVLTLQ